MKKYRTNEFKQAVQIDKKLRKGIKKVQDEIFLHKSCIPLDQVDFDKKDDKKQLDMFNNECEGMCGV